jgi:protoporphyrinogen oxidase
MSASIQPKRVAIVGAGAAGLYASHLLRKKFGPHAEIHHFEAQDRIGGRLRPFKVRTSKRFFVKIHHVQVK